MTTIYTAGYASPQGQERVEVFMRGRLTVGVPASKIMLVDTRLRPVSPFRPQWCKRGLTQVYGDRYVSVPDLGNLNYRDRRLPIMLRNAAAGLAQVLALIDRGCVVCLLCACAQVETCHRRVVADLLRERCSCRVVHL